MIWIFFFFTPEHFCFLAVLGGLDETLKIVHVTLRYDSHTLRMMDIAPSVI